MVVAEHELYRACQIIFGPELNVSREFLEYLQWPGIKSAYRKRALETHPDLVASRGEQIQLFHTNLFQNIQEAYENLTCYLEARDKGYRFPPDPQRDFRRHGSEGRSRQNSTSVKTKGAADPSRRQTRAGATGRQADRQKPQTNADTYRSTEKFYQGSIPDHKLLFGHYLYYSGITTWRTIIQALIWQRTGRPRLGEIGRRFGMINEEDIQLVLKYRTVLQPFGESAVRLGLLSERQLKMLIFHQKCLQKKFGEFFVEKRIFNPVRLTQLLEKHKAHNAPFVVAAYRKRFN